jgi:hypothetical protein
VDDDFDAARFARSFESFLGANPDLADHLDLFEPGRAPELGVGGWFAFGSSDGPDDVS